MDESNYVKIANMSKGSSSKDNFVWKKIERVMIEDGFDPPVCGETWQDAGDKILSYIQALRQRFANRHENFAPWRRT